MAGRAVLFLIVGSLLVGGCAGPSLYPRVISEEEDRFVRLEARYGYGQEGEGMRFSHPFALSETDWARILEGTYIKRKGWLLSLGGSDHSPTPAFQEGDRAYLAENLAMAFSLARPDEWIVFYLTHPREREVHEITSGGFFVAQGQVHLVLANYRQPVSMSFVREEIRSDPLRPAGKTYYEMVPQEHQTLESYLRWYPTKPLLSYPSELVIDYVAFLKPTEGKETPIDPQRDDNGLHGGHGTAIEDRLRTLDRLHEQGLITDEEYRSKRAKLLDEL